IRHRCAPLSGQLHLLLSLASAPQAQACTGAELRLHSCPPPVRIPADPGRLALLDHLDHTSVCAHSSPDRPVFRPLRWQEPVQKGLSLHSTSYALLRGDVNPCFVRCQDLGSSSHVENAVNKLPNFTHFLAFCYFPATFVVGPLIPFK